MIYQDFEQSQVVVPSAEHYQQQNHDRPNGRGDNSCDEKDSPSAAVVLFEDGVEPLSN